MYVALTYTRYFQTSGPARSMCKVCHITRPKRREDPIFLKNTYIHVQLKKNKKLYIFRVCQTLSDYDKMFIKGPELASLSDQDALPLNKQINHKSLIIQLLILG